MGTLVDSGLGWYLDEDYLLTLGSQTLGTVDSGGSATSPPCLPVVDPNDRSTWGAAVPITTWPGYTGYWYAGASTSKVLVYVSTDYQAIWYMSDAPFYRVSYWNNYESAEVSSSHQVPYSAYSYLYYNHDQHVTALPPVSGSPYIKAICANDQEVLVDAAAYFSGAGQTSTITKVQGGAGAFAFVSYPKDGGTVYVGVGISSIPNPNSAATVAVDGTNGSYDTFNREHINFTMYYTPELSGTLTNNVPVVSISDELDTSSPLYKARLFLAVANAAQIHAGPAPQGEDPYSGGGTSEPSSGTPDFTEVSESISPGSTFPISFQSTGLCRVYVPSLRDLNDLANYLWTDPAFLDTIKNILINQFENFMEAVISLTMVPCQVPKDTAQPVKVMFLSTGLSFPPATQQFVEVNCGYVDITERYASALDYNPYTKVSLYLPFIGTVPLDTDEVMGHRVKCVYTIDIVSGACVAKIMVDYPDTSNGVMYQFSGHCSISMPLTAADFSSYYAAAMSGLKMAAGLAAAGAGAPGLAGTLLGEPTAHPSSTTTTTRTTGRNAATGRQILTGTESRETSHTPGQASFKELATRASVNTVGAVINSKFSVEHSGGFTGNTGFLGVQAPYVIITRPDMCNPEEYGAYNGRPSMMYLYLGSLSGFTQVQNIKLTGIPATNPELGEIAELLKTGVIL